MKNYNVDVLRRVLKDMPSLARPVNVVGRDNYRLFIKLLAYTLPLFEDKPLKVEFTTCLADFINMRFRCREDNVIEVHKAQDRVIYSADVDYESMSFIYGFSNQLPEMNDTLETFLTFFPRYHLRSLEDSMVKRFLLYLELEKQL